MFKCIQTRYHSMLCANCVLKDDVFSLLLSGSHISHGSVAFKCFIFCSINATTLNKSSPTAQNVDLTSVQFQFLLSCFSCCPVDNGLTSHPLWQCVGSIQPLTQRGQKRLTGLGWLPSTAAPPRVQRPK